MVCLAETVTDAGAWRLGGLFRVCGGDRGRSWGGKSLGLLEEGETIGGFSLGESVDGVGFFHARAAERRSAPVVKWG